MSEQCTTVECLTLEREEKRREQVRTTTAGEERQTTLRQYEKFLDSLPDAMVVVSRAGKIEQVNSQLEKLFGYKKAELLGGNLEVLMPERFRARHRFNVQDFMSHPRIRPMGTGLELFGLTRDGTEFPVDIHLSYLTIDGELFAIAAVRDVTERKKSERSIELNYRTQAAISSVLRISLEPLPLEERISRVLDLILNIPGFAMHARGSIYLAEQGPDRLALKAMHGFTVAQVASCESVSLGAGQTGAAARACPVVDIACLDENREIRYTEKASGGEYCVPIVSRERTLGLINVAVMDGHKPVPEEEAFLSAIADSLAGLIERDRAEASKNQLREQLAESEKFAALGRITANVSHTIRNPLMTIGGFANRLMDKLPEGTKERKYAGLIYAEALRLENVLQNVLLFSRRDAERREPSSLADITGKALLMYEDLCAEKSILLEKRFDETPQINANKEQVLQALENLISNAIDAMPNGGTLTATIRRETVRGATHAALHLKDTGQGIAPENLTRIFEPFFTTKVLLKGTGVGLAIVKKVVEDHGGFVHVDSEPGAGAVFSLYFPLQPELEAG